MLVGFYSGIFSDLMQCCMYVLACICSYKLLSNSSVGVVSSPGLSNLWYTWEDFLGVRHSLMSQFFFIYFALSFVSLM